jgi:hypothetical protein
LEDLDGNGTVAFDCEDVDWIYLAQKAEVAGSCEYGNNPSGCIKGENILRQLSYC